MTIKTITFTILIIDLLPFLKEIRITVKMLVKYYGNHKSRANQWKPTFSCFSFQKTAVKRPLPFRAYGKRHLGQQKLTGRRDHSALIVSAFNSTLLWTRRFYLFTTSGPLGSHVQKLSGRLLKGMGEGISHMTSRLSDKWFHLFVCPLPTPTTIRHHSLHFKRTSCGQFSRSQCSLCSTLFVFARVCTLHIADDTSRKASLSSTHSIYSRIVILRSSNRWRRFCTDGLQLFLCLNSCFAFFVAAWSAG